MQGVTVLGSTGSIGVNTLNVLARHRTRYRVVALTAHTQVERLFEQCRRFVPQKAVMMDARAAKALRQRVQSAGLEIEVLAGLEGLTAAASLPEVDTVMAAIVGAAGLLPTLEAVRAGKRVLLANKEPLVMVGDLIMHEARKSGAVLLPIDSEHNAVFQCMPCGFSIRPPQTGNGSDPAAEWRRLGVRRILLTGSGGPLRTTPLKDLSAVTPEQACTHPNWNMGRKISVDSATMMNKGLELIEACRLFHTTADKVEVVIHPQSVIHSMVEYVDGSVLAQLSNPDMRTPIAHALAWPGRMESGVKSLDIFAIARLDFEAPDMARFPCLRLAEQAAVSGGTNPAILNAANEEAVGAFLDKRLAFSGIPAVIEETLSAVNADPVSTLEAVLAADRQAREVARVLAKRLGERLHRFDAGRQRGGYELPLKEPTKHAT